MNTLAERLHWARTKKNLSQAALAKLSGVSQSSIGNLEAGVRFSSRRVANIAEALDVSTIWLAEGVGSPELTQESRPVVAGRDDVEKIAIPRVLLKLSAGITGFQTEPDYSEGGVFLVDPTWLDRNKFDAKKLVAIEVKGESMEPALYDGDTVIINTSDKQLVDGAVFAMNYEGETVVKRLTRDAGNWWLSSDNPDQRRFYRKVCQGEGCLVIGKIVKREGNRI